MFYDPNISIEAENKLYTLVQRKSIPEHIKLFEMLCSEAGVIPINLVKTFLHSLKEEVHRKIAEVAADTGNESLLKEYPKIKAWLLGYHSRQTTKYSSFRTNPGFSGQHSSAGNRYRADSTFSSHSGHSGVTPMDLSVIETTVLKDMDPDARGIFIATCKSQGRCYGCGSKNHMISDCATRLNKGESTSYLYSITDMKTPSTTSFVTELTISSRKIKVLVDTGAHISHLHCISR